MSTLTAMRTTASRTPAAAGVTTTTSASIEPMTGAGRRLAREASIHNDGAVGGERLVEGFSERFFAVRRMNRRTRIAREGSDVVSLPRVVARDDDDRQLARDRRRKTMT